MKFISCQNKEWTAGDVSHLKLGINFESMIRHPYLRRYETAVLHGQAALREDFGYVRRVLNLT